MKEALHHRCPRPHLLGALLAVTVASGCGVQEIIMEPFRGDTPHERYTELLERSGLDETALAHDWMRAAREALASPVTADPPMSEAGWLPAESPTALGYRVQMERGQRLSVNVELEGDNDTRVFLEVFRVRGRGEDDEEGPSLLTVAWADPPARSITYDASTTATFLVRVQPELLRGGPYELHLEVGPSLAFPVEGAELRDIGSFFGAARDGGARSHHGVDIFAPRGTPVLAASDGRVRRVRETPVGGKNVWLRSDGSGHSEYYAHLDSQVVVTGQQVSAGDTVGFVGNTGNAVTTPPHLHFGIYSRGPVDPLPYLRDPGGAPAALQVDADWFNRRAILTGADAPILAGAGPSADTLQIAPADLPLRVLAGSGAWARVRLPDGGQGFVDPARLRKANDPVAWYRAAHETATRSPAGDPPAEAPGLTSGVHPG